MKIRNGLMAGGLAIALVAPSALVAADSVAFNKADANKDMAVTQEELGAHPEIAARFEVLDRDRSGGLDRREFNRGMAESIPERAKQAG